MVRDNDKFYDDVYFDSDDSGSEESVQKYSGLEETRGSKRVLSNGELFYDPKMDERDQEWVNKLRRSYQIKNVKRSGYVPKSTKNNNGAPSSDAVLNCPACLTMLCMDCQRHEVYHNQYRAMFVFNCMVKWNEILKFPKKDGKKKKFSKGKKLLQKQELLSSTGHQIDSVADGKSPEKIEEVLERNFHAKNITNEANCLGEEQSSNITETCPVQDEDELFHPVLCSICKTKVAVYDKEEVYHFFNVVSSH
ncbi:E2F-associated phosphoprotein-like [Macrobrachium nipponense]|uniref:E2F-associated phosphoprotein-like n=1 Tax=Macrobrachium nipponense TaxID=159736 RepID=UPI0030C7FC5E